MKNQQKDMHESHATKKSTRQRRVQSEKSTKRYAHVTCKRKIEKKLTSGMQSEKATKRYSQVTCNQKIQKEFTTCVQSEISTKKSAQVTCEQKIQRNLQVACKVKNQ